MDKGFMVYCCSRVGRIVDVFAAGNLKFDDPALQNAECYQKKGNKRRCLNIEYIGIPQAGDNCPL